MGRDGCSEPFTRVKAPLCAECDGFSLHAAVVVAARDRERLEKLCRHAGRPAVAESRLLESPDGRIGYVLKKRWRDGTTHVVMAKEVLMERLRRQVGWQPPSGCQPTCIATRAPRLAVALRATASAVCSPRCARWCRDRVGIW